MSIPAHRDALTNELAIRKFSLAFTNVLDLPKGPYHLEEYEERVAGGVFIALLVFRAIPKMKVIVEMIGPVIEDQEFDWGLDLDPEEGTIQKIGDEQVVRLKGYLRPA